MTTTSAGVWGSPEGPNQSVVEQKTVRMIRAGKHHTPLYVHCGTILPGWTPPRLRIPPAGLTNDTDLQEWYDRREKYRWRVVQQFPNGRIKIICPQCSGRVMTTARTRNPNRPNRTQRPNQPVVAVPDTEYCCDGMITLQVDQIDNYQRNAYGTTKWATDYAGRNPVEGVNGMIKSDGTFNPESCRVFGTAAHTLAALAAIVIHNPGAHRSEQATTPPDTPHPHTADPTHTRAPP